MFILEMFKDDLAESVSMSDVLTARELIGQALKDSHKKHEYFDFLSFLRKKHGQDYSSSVHREASKLVRTSA